MRFGPNELPVRRRPPYLAIAVRQVADPLVLLLIAASAVSIAIGQAVDAAIIAAIVVINGTLGFAQEVSADRAVIALRDVLERHASVVREGSEREVPVREVVPGDLVVLREGERIPADARLVTAESLAVDEAALTGESFPVDKSTRAVPAGTPLGDRQSVAFAGTGVTRGRATALVTATGADAQVGQVAALTASAQPPRTPLQRRLDGLTRVLVAVGVLITVALAGAELAQGADPEEAFLVGVSVAVAAVPEGLAATVTIALALGARRMAERGAIVRRLSAVETLGSATVIASDKTGTLTENALRLHSIEPAAPHTDAELLEAAVMATAAELIDDHGEVRGVGDPLDVAILIGARDRGTDPAAIRPGRTQVGHLPFDAERRRATFVYSDGEHTSAFTKGAPEVVLARSRGGAPGRAELEELAERWASTGLRVLAVASRALTGTELRAEELESDLEPLGLIALHDPLRASAPAAVREARSAGLGVRVLTGDHAATARATAEALDLPPSAVAARVTPQDKLRIVEELQAAREVVAVTGDGVNDAPALRRADVGVAMGRTGTEAAREAADVVLTDDDFSTIVAAVREGRAIAANVRKFVTFLLSANLGEVLVFAVTIVAGLGPPMTVVQILVVNVLTDGLPAVALARDAPAPGTMRRAPERGDRLFTGSGWGALVLVGLTVGACSLAAFLIGREMDRGAAQTMAFATLALSELVLVFALRAPREAAWREPRNPWLVGSVLVSALLVALAVYIPGLHGALGTVSLDASEAAIVAVLTVAPFALVEAAKLLRRRGLVPLPAAGAGTPPP